MRIIFQKLAQYALLRAVIYIALGIVMLIWPQTVMNVIVYILAAYAIVMGLVTIISAVRSRQTSDDFGYSLTTGILMLALGAVLIIFTQAILSILPIFLGVLLILGGAFNLAQALSAGRSIGKTNIFLIFAGILVIIGGVLVIFNPFGAAVILFRIFAAAVIIMGIGEAINYFTYRKISKLG